MINDKELYILKRKYDKRIEDEINEDR